MIIKTVRGFSPQIDENVFIAENAAILGDVKIGEKSSVWYSVTIRGDVMPIVIGREVNIQDGTVIHGTFGKASVEIGDRTTIGHLAMLHGCKIGKRCLIGMGSIVMDGVQIGDQSIIGAGSLVTEGMQIPPRSLVLGRPAKVKRELTQEEIDSLDYSADNYILYTSWYK